MKRWTDAHGIPHTEFDGIEEITPDSLGPIVDELFGQVAKNETATIVTVPVVTDDTLTLATECAEHLDYLTGVIHDQGIRDWLNDASIHLRELVAAVRVYQDGAA